MGSTLTGSDPSIKTGPALTGGQQKIAGDLRKFLRPRIGEPLEAFGPTTPWQAGDPFAFTAAQSPFEQQALGSLSDILGGLGAQSQRWSPVYEGAVSSALQGLDPQFMTDWFKQSVLPQQQRFFQEQVMPGVTESFVGPGLIHGGGRAEAEARAQMGFGEQMAGQLGQAIMQGQQFGRQALGAAQGLAAPPTAEAGALMQAGALPRALEQQEMMARLQEFLRTRPEYSPIISQAMQFLGIPMMTAMGMPGTPGLIREGAEFSLDLVRALRGGKQGE